MRVARIILSVFLCVLFVPAKSWAQDLDAWRFSVAPYAWFADSSGTQSVLGFSTDVDLDFFDDVSDNIDQAFQFHFEAERGRWAIILDPTYLDIYTVEPRGPTTLETHAKSVIVDMKAGLALSEPLQILFGLRYYESDLDLILPNLARSQDESWVDVVFGARYQWELSEKWTLLGETDIGGLGAGSGSDFSWNLSVVANRRLTDSVSLAFGYRLLDIDYDDGLDSRRFVYDIRNTGPLIGVDFEF